MLTIKRILKEAGNPENVSIQCYNKDNYYLIVYDDSDKVFETRSVYVSRLKHMSLNAWVEEVKQLIKDVENVKPN